MKGIIVKGIGGFYAVKTASNIEYECKARGVFRKENLKPMIGDKVEIEIDPKSELPKGFITQIYPRTSSMIRPPVANIDTMILVVAAASPEPSLFLIDKMLVNAHISGIKPVICINKSDITKRDDIEKIYSDAGYKVIYASAQHEYGIEDLKEVLHNRVTAFAGLSGVGKSSLLSIITESYIETGEVSCKISRGKHTTRHVELFELKDGGFVLDTPGFSSLEIEGINAQDLWRYFPEISSVNEQCRFRGCSHINEPDCAVKMRVQAGMIAKSRYESYRQIYEKLKIIKDWQKK